MAKIKKFQQGNPLGGGFFDYYSKVAGGPRTDSLFDPYKSKKTKFIDGLNIFNTKGTLTNNSLGNGAKTKSNLAIDVGAGASGIGTGGGLSYGSVFQDAAAAIGSATDIFNTKGKDQKRAIADTGINVGAGVANVLLPGSGELLKIQDKLYGTLYDIIDPVKEVDKSATVSASSGFGGVQGAVSDNIAETDKYKGSGLLGKVLTGRPDIDVDKINRQQGKAADILKKGKKDRLRQSANLDLARQNNLSKIYGGVNPTIIGRQGMSIDDSNNKIDDFIKSLKRGENTNKYKNAYSEGKKNNMKSILKNMFSKEIYDAIKDEDFDDTSKIQIIIQKKLFGGEINDPIKSMKNGGEMNIIAEGVLHARKNSIDNKKITHKGIPIVIEEDGKVIEQVAEIEVNELIVRDKKMLKLINMGLDKIPDEKLEILGRYIADQLFNNTIDNSNNKLS